MDFSLPKPGSTNNKPTTCYMGASCIGFMLEGLGLSQQSKVQAPLSPRCGCAYQIVLAWGMYGVLVLANLS